jgi:hypothetical protein
VTKKRQKRRRKAKSQRDEPRTEVMPGGGTQTTVPPPKARMKPLFKVFDLIIRTCQDTLFKTDVQNPLARFDAGIVLRGLNTLRSIRLLLEQAHWELASAGARQLFELLVNVEYISRQDDREDACRQFVRFGLLQTARRRLLEMEYAEETDRAVDQSRKATIERFIDSAFEEFRDKMGGFVSSWNRKNARALAEESKSPLRAKQYEMLFTEWSEETHGAPAALLPNIFGPTNEWIIEEIVAGDDREIIEIAFTSITLFLQLWVALSFAPAPDRELLEATFAKLSEFAKSQGIGLPLRAEFPLGKTTVGDWPGDRC